MNHLWPWLAVLLLPLYAWADRRVGRGHDHDRSSAIATVLTFGTVISFCAGGWVLVAMPLIWAIQRSLDFWHNSATPMSLVDGLVTIVRHGVVLPLTAGAMALSGGRYLLPLLIMAAYVGVAVLLAFWYAAEVRHALVNDRPIGNENVWVERLRGGAFGLAMLAIACGMSAAAPTVL